MNIGGNIISSKLAKLSVFGASVGASASAAANAQRQQQQDQQGPAAMDQVRFSAKNIWSPIGESDTLSLMPTPKLRQIRIYLCSTFSDFKEEREIIWSDILPELQVHCLQYGVDIFLFDPFQGCSSDTIYKPHLFRERLQIQKCYEHSEGVFFICLIGDNYGPCHLPEVLKAEEFQQIKSSLTQKGDLELLNSWYKLDQNCVPPVNKLQDTKNKKFNQKTFQQLWSFIRAGLKCNDKKQPSDTTNEIFVSAVEKCTRCALQAGNNAQQNSLFAIRSFEIVDQANRNFNVGVNFDNDDFVDNAQEKLAKFKSLIQDTIDKPNLESFKIGCQNNPNSKGINLNDKEWAKYKEKFSQQILYKLKQLIDRQYASGSHWTGPFSVEAEMYFQNNAHLKHVYEHCWHHYREFARRRKTKFCGQNDLLSKTKENLRKCMKKQISPLIIQGDETCGKTTMLCEIASSIKQWLNGSTVNVVCRFVNLNACSKFVHELLFNLCVQLCTFFELDDLFAKHRNCYYTEKIIDWFNAVLCEASAKLIAQQQYLLICIDDLHLVKYGVHAGGRVLSSLPWIPDILPKNILLFATVGKNFTANKLPLKNAQVATMLQMQTYKDGELFEIVKRVLEECQKTLNQEQESSLKKTLKQCSNPFYARLLGQESSNWSCYHATNGQGIPYSIGQFIDDKLQKMEKSYGYEICSTLCTFIECGHYGLTESEIIDLVGDNRDLVQKIYNEQGLPKIGPFPCYLWLMLKEELGIFLNESVWDGKVVFTWPHTIISNAIRYRYLKSSLQLKKCHCSIANLYRNSNTLNNEGANNVEDENLIKFAITQKMWSLHPSTSEIIYNRRATHNLWYHLLHSGSVNDFEEQSLCNFLYLECVLNVSGLVHLISIMEDALLQLLDHNLHILYGTVIRPAVETLSFSTKQFAAELIGRLNFTKGRNTPVLNALLDQAMAWVDNDCTIPLVVPLTAWLRPPLCPLVVNFQIQDWTAGSVTLIQPTINYQHLLVTGMPNGKIAMYHILTSTVVKTFSGHTDRVLCLELSHNGQFFATGSADTNVRTWDIQNGNCIKILNIHTEKVLCTLFTDNDQTLFTGSADSSVKMTTLESGQILRTFVGHSGSVHTLAINNRNEYLISGSSDFVVLVWNIGTGQSVFKLDGLMAPVSNLALTANDTFLLVACADETLRVYSLCLAKDLHELQGHEGSVSSLVVARDDCQVFAGTSEGQICCYDLHTGQLFSTQNCHTAPVTSLKITKDGNFLISACADNVHVWNIDRPTDFYKQDATNIITAVTMSRDYKYVASGNVFGTIFLWDLEFCQCLWITQDDPPEKISHLSFDIETSYLFAGQADGSVCVWSMTTGHLLRKYKSHTYPVKYIRLFHDKVRIVSHDWSGTVKIWRLMPPEQEDDDKDLAEIKGTGDSVRLANDKDILANAPDFPKEVRIWNITNEDIPMVRSKLNHNDTVTCMVLSLDGKLAVTGSRDQSLKVWEVSTGYLTQRNSEQIWNTLGFIISLNTEIKKTIKTPLKLSRKAYFNEILVGHESPVLYCAVSDDCQIAASGAADNSVYSWDIETGSILSSFNTDNKDISAVSITHDGFVAFIGYKDGWLHAWSSETGRKVASFNAHTAILDVLVSREAHRLVLKLDQSTKVAIVCLHNCPAFGDSDSARRRKRSRALSVSSLGSTGSFVSAGSVNPLCAPSSPPLASPGMRATTPGQFRCAQQSSQAVLDEKFKERWNSEKIKDRKQLKVFAAIEHSRSKGSLYDSSTSTSSIKVPSERARQYAHSASNQNNASKICAIV